MNKTLDSNKPSLNTTSNFIRILFNNDNISGSSPKATTTTTIDIPDTLNVSYCYTTKEWRCLYRCEIDSSLSNSSSTTVGLTLFGSVNNPTEEDWSQIELILVANELEILNNNKPAPRIANSREEPDSSDVRSSGGMQIFVKTLTGKTITIDVCITEKFIS